MQEIQYSNDNELQALVSLLDEPNRQMFGKIQEKLLSYGIEAIPILEEKWDDCYDDFVQQRIENLIHKIQFENTCSDLSEWVNSENHELLDGYFLVTKYMYPELEKDDIFRRIDVLINDVKHVLSDNLTALQKVRAINHVIFDIHNFKAVRRNPHPAKQHLLNNLLDKKKGSNLSLGILYLIVVSRLNIPVYGVEIPKHFILSFTNRNKNSKEDCVSSDEVLFYINPGTSGSILTREDIDLSVKQMGIPSNPSLFCPCDEIKVIRRVVDEMAFYFRKNDMSVKENELQLLMNILTT